MPMPVTIWLAAGGVGRRQRGGGQEAGGRQGGGWVGRRLGEMRPSHPMHAPSRRVHTQQPTGPTIDCSVVAVGIVGDAIRPRGAVDKNVAHGASGYRRRRRLLRQAAGGQKQGQPFEPDQVCVHGTSSGARVTQRSVAHKVRHKTQRGTSFCRGCCGGSGGGSGGGLGPARPSAAEVGMGEERPPLLLASPCCRQHGCIAGRQRTCYAGSGTRGSVCGGPGQRLGPRPPLSLPRHSEVT